MWGRIGLNFDIDKMGVSLAPVCGEGLEKDLKKAFKYKIAKMNRESEKFLFQTLNLCRHLYNCALEERITAYKNNKITMSGYEQKRELVEVKNNFPEYKKADAAVYQNVILNLDKSYKNFFRRVKQGNEKPGFPKFKSRKKFKSFRLNWTGYKLNGKWIYMTKRKDILGKYKLHLHRPILGKIKTVQFVFENNSWWVVFSCDNVPENPYPKTGKAVGIDVGIKSFCVDSDNHIIQNPKYYHNSIKKLNKKQRALARKKRGSNRRKQCVRELAGIHNKIKNQRNYFLHCTSKYYVENYEHITVEKLKIKNLQKNKRGTKENPREHGSVARKKVLSRNIADAGWGKFFELVEYKSTEHGRIFEKIPPHNTTQICSQCGEKVQKKLKDRVHNCPYCGLVIDRDYNAAINIKNKSDNQAEQALTTPVVVCKPCTNVDKQLKLISV